MTTDIETRCEFEAPPGRDELREEEKSRDKIEHMSTRANKLFESKLTSLHIKTDRWFAYLLLAEWCAAIVSSVVVSPLAWAGRNSHLHPHVLFAVFTGAALFLPVLYLVLNRPGAAITRHLIAVNQMLFSALLIHLTGGRIETHFHIFGSLAFLAFYRDTRVLCTATAVVLADHLVRGIMIPESVYGVLSASPWRSVEHAAWVVFENFFLAQSCLSIIKQMKVEAIQQDELESTYEHVQELAEKRAQELQSTKEESQFLLSQLAMIAETSHDAIIGWSLDNIITSWNKGAEEMYGYSADEAIGKHKSIIVPMDREQEMDELTQQILADNNITDFDTQRLRKNGTLIDVSISASPIRWNNGPITGISAIARDITERKELEKRIAEFYSTVSHELRTPLTSIRGSLSLIDDEIVEPGSDEAREMIKIAKTSSERLVRLINDILDLRKIEAGKLELHLVERQPHSILDKSIESMQGMARQSGVSISSCVEGDYLLKVDEDRIQQVLTNLLSNAIKFSKAGDSILVTAKAYDGTLMRVSVVDEGPGIPVDAQQKLFEKFQQVDSSDTRQQGGTGLGLAISKAIVQQHGGTIGLHSRVGIGSTFWFELPAREQVIQPKAPTVVTESPRQEKLVLIVEDDLGLAQLLELRLKKVGYGTACAHTLATARQIVRGQKPDVVLLDLLLPDGNGLDLLREMKTDVQLANVPVILASGLDREELPSAPPIVFDWFQKPYNEEDLLSSIKRASNQNMKSKILIVEDDFETRKVIVAQLQQLKAICIEAEDAKTALCLALEKRPNIVILDVGLPDSSGFDVISRLREAEYDIDALLVYTAQDLTMADKDLLSLGITRHLTKGMVAPNEFLETVKDLIEKTTEMNLEDGVMSQEAKTAAQLTVS